MDSDPSGALPPTLEALAQVVQAVATIQYPGLPPLPPNVVGVEFHQYVGAASSGLTEIAASAQYLQVPPLALAIDSVLSNVKVPPPGFNYALTSALHAYVISPEGAAHPFGDLPPFRTRLLAFGILPVEATVRLSQVRDARDLPEFLSASAPFEYDARNFSKNENAALTGQLQVQVDDVTVDGTPVDVGANCHAATPASLDLVGRGYWSDGGFPATYWTLDSNSPTPATVRTAQQIADDYYTPANGGLLSGTVDIPAFTGCVGQDGDLSRLVSAAVSSKGQPIAIRQTFSGECFPAEARDNCTPPKPFPYPSSSTFPYPPAD